ncbi:MAG: DUF302 domain-containing protein [Casimicrobiaceae bacterium]|nr:DUF302 domain-containing protein [Casimicrobiaceae bacterium]MCX8099293.1 DUF302 domain-containing protein [Casimicrobiaceae bacterium]MDW8313020.1 hypothetical protein [Burkholderiales bacterium]
MLKPVLVGILLGFTATLAAAQGAGPVVAYTKQGRFEDVRDDLKAAIEARGLVIDFHSHVNKMLERTGADVGSTKKLYVDAQAFVFCSAKLSRAMMEADVANAALCPYSISVHATAAKPNEVVVAYRPLVSPVKSAASQKAVAEVNKLLDQIAREAVGKKK